MISTVQTEACRLISNCFQIRHVWTRMHRDAREPATITPIMTCSEMSCTEESFACMGGFHGRYDREGAASYSSFHPSMVTNELRTWSRIPLPVSQSWIHAGRALPNSIIYTTGTSPAKPPSKATDISSKELSNIPQVLIHTRFRLPFCCPLYTPISCLTCCRTP